MPGKPRRLTAKQEAFAQNVASGMNQTAAYTAAYAAENMALTTVAKRAHELLEDGNIAGRVEQLQAHALAAAQTTVDRIVAELATVAFSDLADVAEFDGDQLHILPFTEMPPHARRAIQSMKTTRKRQFHSGQAHEGWETETVEIKLWPKTDALDKLARRAGLYELKQDEDERNAWAAAISAAVALVRSDPAARARLVGESHVVPDYDE